MATKSEPLRITAIDKFGKVLDDHVKVFSKYSSLDHLLAVEKAIYPSATRIIFDIALNQGQDDE